MINKVILVGNLTRDVELRYTPNGIATATLGIAVNRFFKNPAGEKQQEALFIDIETWGNVANNCAKYLKKGNKIAVEGRLKQETWEDKTDGGKRSKIKIVSEQIMFLESKKADELSENSEE